MCNEASLPGDTPRWQRAHTRHQTIDKQDRIAKQTATQADGRLFSLHAEQEQSVFGHWVAIFTGLWSTAF